jgi:putative flippase GtrA
MLITQKPPRMNSFKSVINTLYRDSPDHFLVQLIRYVISGGVAFCIDFGLLYTLTEYGGINYNISNVISVIASTSASYLLNTLWVFNNRRFKNIKSEILIFFGINGVGLLLNPLLMWLLTAKLGIYYIKTKVIITVIVVVWNYVAKKWILFPNKTS